VLWILVVLDDEPGIFPSDRSRQMLVCVRQKKGEYRSLAVGDSLRLLTIWRTRKPCFSPMRITNLMHGSMCLSPILPNIQTDLNLSDEALMRLNTAIQGWQDKLAVSRRATSALLVEGLTLGPKLKRESQPGGTKNSWHSIPSLRHCFKSITGQPIYLYQRPAFIAERHRTHLLTFSDGGELPPGVVGCQISALINGSAPSGTIGYVAKDGVDVSQPIQTALRGKACWKTVIYRLSWVMSGGEVGLSGRTLRRKYFPDCRE